jgi:hypothetical protein
MEKRVEVAIARLNLATEKIKNQHHLDGFFIAARALSKRQHAINWQ